MRSLAGHFLRGLLISAPAAITLYICWVLISTIDGWLNIGVPGQASWLPSRSSR